MLLFSFKPIKVEVLNYWTKFGGSKGTRGKGGRTPLNFIKCHRVCFANSKAKKIEA